MAAELVLPDRADVVTRLVAMVFGVASAATIIGLSAWGVLAAASGGTSAWLRLVFLLPIARGEVDIRPLWQILTLAGRSTLALHAPALPC